MTRTLFILCLALLYPLSACGHRAASAIPVSVRTIQISDVVTPEAVYAMQGEEIRWQNLRANPILVGFLSKRLLDDLGCAKGVATFWGGTNDLVTIPPGESISLCFARAGILRYNVWFDADNLKGLMSRTAAVYVEAGS
jgi:hypothetical protein